MSVLEARSPRARCGQGWFLLRAEQEDLFHVPPLISNSLQAIFGVPWLIEVLPLSLSSSSHGVLPVSMSETA